MVCFPDLVKPQTPELLPLRPLDLSSLSIYVAGSWQRCEEEERYYRAMREELRSNWQADVALQG